MQRRKTNRAGRWLTRSTAGLALVALPMLASGCYARAGAGGHVVYEEPVYEAEVVPARIEYYPRVQYRGQYVYYVDGRWYAPSSRARRGWVVYRDEPRELRRYRVEGRWDRHPAYRERRPRNEPGYGSPPPRRRHPR